MRRRERPQLVPPSRWMMLTAALALLAVLLAARALPPSHGRQSFHPLPPTSTSTHLRAARHHLETPTTRAPRPSVTSTTAAPSTSVRSLAARVTSSPGDTTASPPVSAASSSGIPTGAATTSTERIVNGWLDGPTSVAASYLIAPSQPTLIRATWSGAATLQLVVACSGSSTQLTGGSGLSLTAAASSCTVTLQGPADVPPTSYMIDLGPA